MREEREEKGKVDGCMWMDIHLAPDPNQPQHGSLPVSLPVSHVILGVIRAEGSGTEASGWSSTV